MGMLKEGVRLDRVRGGRQKYRRVTPYSNNGGAGGASSTAVTASAASTESTSASNAAAGAASSGTQSAKKISLEGTFSQCFHTHTHTLSMLASARLGAWPALRFIHINHELLFGSFPLPSSSSSSFFVSLDNKILSTLGQCEPEMLTTADIMWPEGESTLANLNPSLRMLCTLSELYDRELVAAIGWAKQIPGNLV
jgi:hypothetical protein